MLQGIDVSHHQNLEVWKNENVDFVVIKATEGRSYTDPLLTKNTEQATKKTRYIGFYHYARAEKNTATAEAEHFCNKVRAMYSEFHCNPLIALDFEGKSLDWGTKEDRVQWVTTFCDEVENILGCRPLVYMSSYASRVHNRISEKEKMWVAHYGVTKPKITDKTNLYMWQDTSKYNGKNLDHDIFYGNKIDWNTLTLDFLPKAIEKAKAEGMELVNKTLDLMKGVYTKL